MLGANRDLVQRFWTADVHLSTAFAPDLDVAHDGTAASGDATALIGQPQGHTDASCPFAERSVSPLPTPRRRTVVGNDIGEVADG
jgi:hypothetical protein